MIPYIFNFIVIAIFIIVGVYYIIKEKNFYVKISSLLCIILYVITFIYVTGCSF